MNDNANYQQYPQKIQNKISLKFLSSPVIDLSRIYSSQELKINDEDFSAYDQLNGIEFKNQTLIDRYNRQFNNMQQDELFKTLFVLKNRNENLLVNFILHIYFEEYIQSQEFAQLVMEQNLIQNTFDFQNKIFS
ncbi:hypothetical protein ABPG72_020180 [Tetrahymena utriculariae]